MKSIDDFYNVLESRHLFIRHFLSREIAKRGIIAGELKGLQIFRDELNRIVHIEGHDGQDRRHRLQFHWAETDRVKAGEALLFAGGAVSARIAVAWNHGVCSSRLLLPEYGIRFAGNGEAEEQRAKIQLSYQGDVLEGEARDGDVDLPFLRSFATAVDAHEPPSRMRHHIELLLPLLTEIDRIAIESRPAPGRITRGEGVLCAIGTAGCLYVAGPAGLAYAFVCFGLAALG